MKRTLEGRLKSTLSLTIVLAGILAAAASFRFNYGEAQEFQDDTLRQIAAFASKGGLPRDFSPSSAIDPEVRIQVLAPGDEPWLPKDISPGFHTLAGPGGKWRVFVRAGIAAAQATEARDEIAIHSSLRTLAPFALLLPLLAWLSSRIVRSELSSLRSLSRLLEKRSSPSPLPAGSLPGEISPFVEAINSQMERIASLMNQQKRFIADAAHELRTPLAAISLQVQNLESAEDREMLQKRLETLKSGVERARRLADQLLKLARSESAPLSKKTVCIPVFFRELLEEYLPIAESGKIDLGLGNCEKIELEADPELLRLLFGNALENALRYTPEGGMVTLSAGIGMDEALLEVSDNGPGIPENEREKVFSPFYRLQGGEGSGLGLSIAKEAAQRIGATLSLEEAAGGGLKFLYRQKISAEDRKEPA